MKTPISLITVVTEFAHKLLQTY